MCPEQLCLFKHSFFGLPLHFIFNIPPHWEMSTVEPGLQLLTLNAHAQRELQYLGLCVCLLSHISPTERLFVLKTGSRTQQVRKVKIFVGICLKRLHCYVAKHERKSHYSDLPAVSFTPSNSPVLSGCHSLFVFVTHSPAMYPKSPA